MNLYQQYITEGAFGQSDILAAVETDQHGVSQYETEGPVTDSELTLARDMKGTGQDKNLIHASDTLQVINTHCSLKKYFHVCLVYFKGNAAWEMNLRD